MMPRPNSTCEIAFGAEPRPTRSCINAFEALSDWDQTIALSLSAEQPPLCATRAMLRLQEGLVAEAVADANEVTKSENWTADQWYNFACVYSVASGKLPDKKWEYADRAMESLPKSH